MKIRCVLCIVDILTVPRNRIGEISARYRVTKPAQKALIVPIKNRPAIIIRKQCLYSYLENPARKKIYFGILILI
jgi:hypothetical protein